MTRWDMKKFFNALAFWALMIASIALVVGRIFTSLNKFLMPIASFLAFLVASVSAFNYARSKRSPVYMILFILAAIIVLAMLLFAIIRG